MDKADSIYRMQRTIDDLRETKQQLTEALIVGQKHIHQLSDEVRELRKLNDATKVLT